MPLQPVAPGRSRSLPVDVRRCWSIVLAAGWVQLSRLAGLLTWWLPEAPSGGAGQALASRVRRHSVRGSPPVTSPALPCPPIPPARRCSGTEEEKAEAEKAFKLVGEANAARPPTGGFSGGGT